MNFSSQCMDWDHIPMPPSTGRPTPVIKRAASEARNSATLARCTTGAHGSERVLDAECGTEDVHLEHPEEVLRVEVYHQCRDLDPGVVHQDVQAIEFVDRPCDRSLPARLIGHVKWDESGGYFRLSESISPSLADILADVRAGHGCASARQCLRHPGTQATRSTSY